MGYSPQHCSFHGIFDSGLSHSLIATNISALRVLKFHTYQLNPLPLSLKSVVFKLSSFSLFPNLHLSLTLWPYHQIVQNLQISGSNKAVSRASIPGSRLCLVHALLKHYIHYPEPPSATLFPNNTQSKVQMGTQVQGHAAVYNRHHMTSMYFGFKGH